jgi:hypothetical protein
VVGIAYGRCIPDLRDEMVSLNYKSGLGKQYIETFLGTPGSNYNIRGSNGEIGVWSAPL